MGKSISKSNCCAPEQFSSNLTLSAEAERLSCIKDDEPILTNSSLDESHELPFVSINLKFASNYLQLSDQVQEWPVCLNLTCSDQQLDDRNGMDIVCLIETSAFSAEKASIIESSIEFLMSRLTGQDRLSIVVYNDSAKRLTPLISMTYTGKIKIRLILKNLKYIGSSDLFEGLVFAFSVLNNRRVINFNSNIIFFSTGKDNHPHSIKERINDLLREFTFRMINIFSIHIFALIQITEILAYLAEETNGNCYFSYADKDFLQNFAYSCGIMESKIGEDVTAKIVLKDTHLPVIISKVYSENGENCFRMPDILAGSSNDTIFLLKFPPCAEDQFFILEILSVLVEYKICGISHIEEVFLKIPVYSQSNICKDIELEEDILVSFYRVKAADILNEATLMSSFDLNSAKELLEKGALELDFCCVKNNKLVRTLSQKIKEIKESIVNTEDCKVEIRTTARNHWAKRSFDIPEYQNSATVINKNRLKALFSIS